MDFIRIGCLTGKNKSPFHRYADKKPSVFYQYKEFLNLKSIANTIYYMLLKPNAYGLPHTEAHRPA